MNANLLVVGVGGQGVMTAAEVLARVALAAGWDACKTEIAGMSQRGGVVSSQVRIGRHVHASEITPGEADVLLALESAEALRWCHWLAPAGHAVINTMRAVPPVVSSGRAAYPEDPVGAVRALGYAASAVNATDIAVALGDVRLANTVMLGAASACLPFEAGALLEEVLRRFAGKQALARLNAEAFEAGRAQAAPSLPPSVRPELLPPSVRPELLPPSVRPELVEGACPELVEGACPELVERACPERLEGLSPNGS